MTLSPKFLNFMKGVVKNITPMSELFSAIMGSLDPGEHIFLARA